MKRLLTLLVLLLPTIAWAGFITQPNGLNTAGNYVLTGSWDFSGATVTGIGVTETLGTVSARGNTNYVSNSIANGMQVGSSANQHVRLGDDPTTGQFVKCVAAGTVNNCDYGPQLNSGKRFRLGDRNNDDMIAFTETTNGTTTAWRERSDNDTTPATGYWSPYFKSDGFYYKDDAGNVTGPLAANQGTLVDWACTGEASTGGTAEYLRGRGTGQTCTTSADFAGAYLFPFTGTASNLYCWIATAPGAGQDNVFTVQTASSPSAAGSNSSLTCSTGNTQTCSDTSNTAAITAGQAFRVQWDPTATATAPSDIACTFRVR